MCACTCLVDSARTRLLESAHAQHTVSERSRFIPRSCVCRSSDTTPSTRVTSRSSVTRSRRVPSSGFSTFVDSMFNSSLTRDLVRAEPRFFDSRSLRACSCFVRGVCTVTLRGAVAGARLADRLTSPDRAVVKVATFCGAVDVPEASEKKSRRYINDAALTE